MQIWVDADACPGEIKELLYRAAQRMKVLNYLGSQGWELVSNKEETIRSSVWVFKRKVKK